MIFDKFNLSNILREGLKKRGFKEATKIQELVIPKILEGDNIIVKSNTGTGKTLSFVIPILNSLTSEKKFTTLILAPTRELVIQINSEIENLLNELIKIDDSIDISVLPIYGGKDIKSQINKLKKSIDIIVATPGRLLDHINRKSIDLSSVKKVVIDEADQMLLMGFRGEINSALSNVDRIEQLILLSATIDPKIKKLAYRYADNIDFISNDVPESIPKNIKQEFIMTTDRQKFDDLCRILDRDNPFLAIIFCRTKNRVDDLELKLAQKGYNCDKIHSDISQAKRERSIKNFRDMKTQILISTDLASRGLDITGLTNIYNYDFPENPHDYIHRIGRTGRIGNNGNACSFITEKNIAVYEELKKIMVP